MSQTKTYALELRDVRKALAARKSFVAPIWP